MGGLRDLFGVKELVELLKEERKAQRELLGEILRTTAKQAETADRMIGVMEGMMKGFEISGLPSSERHLSEQKEAELMEMLIYGEPDDPADGS